MSFGGLSNENDRANIIAYLKQQSWLNLNKNMLFH
jgi:cytochrome c2